MGEARAPASATPPGDDRLAELDGALRRAERRVELLSAFARGIVLEFDRDCRYVDVWATDDSLLAMPAADLIGRTIAEALGEQVGRPLMEGTARVYATGKPESWEYRLDLPVGTRVFRAEGARIRAVSGPDPYRVAVLIRDVTEAREIEGKLAEAERLAALGMLAAGVGHEINNPLAFVGENLRLFARDLVALSSDPSMAAAAGRLEALVRQLPDVVDGVRRVQSIVSGLRLFGRQAPAEPTAVDVRRVLEASIQLAWGEIRHRAQLDRELGEVPTVQASEALLGQVFLNLLVNATQAIDGAGEARPHRIVVRTTTDERGWAVVEIADTGRGIAPEDVPRIFDPFFTTRREGMGLGLSISQRIVDGLGGTIEAHSDLGRGTTMRVALPPMPPAVAVDPPAPEAPTAMPRLRMLIVDDERALLRVLRLTLAPELDVVTAESSAEAIGVLGADPRFDVILCDVMMPDANGASFYEALGHTRPELRDRVVFMTGGAFTREMQEFLASVPNPSIEKPFDHERLQEVLRDLWERRGPVG